MKRRMLAMALVLALAATPGHALDDPTGDHSPRASFQFKGAQARDALRLIAGQFGYSIVIGRDAGGSFSASLVDVTFAQAVAYVAEATGCEVRIHENVLIVNPVGLVSRVLPLQYVDPGAAASAVAKILSEQGSAEPFSGTPAKGQGDATARMNAILVTDSPARVDRVEEALRAIDAKPRLIAIEAKLVETVLGDDEKLGIDWRIQASGTGAILPHTFPFPKDHADGDFTGTPNPNNQVGGVGPGFPPGETFPYARPEDYTFGKLSFQEFTVALDVLKQRSNTNLVSAPTITTLDNREAEIVVGTVVPIALYERLKETGTLEVTGYDEKKVGVRLTVVPHVATDSTLLLSVSPEISEIVEYRGQFNERPVTSTRSASTQVVVRSGETLMIGGLIKTIELEIERKVPFLGDIPILGALFRHKTKSKQKVDLMIFITPRLIGA